MSLHDTNLIHQRSRTPPMVALPTIQPPSFLVFSDDWGRHPSSCQHLIRQLLPRHQVAWVNTIGTRTPKLDVETLKRAAEKLRHWRERRQSPASRAIHPDNERLQTEAGLFPTDPTTFGISATPPPGNTVDAPTVLNPRMWPWFTRAVDRSVNRRLLESQLRTAVGQLPRPRVALTTLPITADLVGRLDVDTWVYYCVDDFREWPGLDGKTLGRMEQDLVQKVDQIITVSETLQRRIQELGRPSRLLTHGVDLAYWSSPPLAPSPTPPLVLFWGVIDQRMDTRFLQELSSQLPNARIQLVGPQQNPDPVLRTLPNVELKPAVPFEELPKLAARADVLVMPYIDAPVTRAMQPLKLKEYLATGKPTVVRALPSTQAWGDALDACQTAAEFAENVRRRLETGLPESQRTARQRLASESWQVKASRLLSWIEDQLAQSRPSNGNLSQAHQNRLPRPEKTDVAGAR